MEIFVDNLGKRYNREWIFRSLNYEFKSGCRVAITGSNGSGKSTLIKILCNYLSPSDGTIKFIDGQKPVDKDSVQLSFSLVAPYVNILNEFTVSEMFNFHRKFKPSTFNTSEILEKSNLQSAADKLIEELSSGMLQRLKLSLAFFFESDVIFLDEPTMNLDLKNVNWYEDQISALKEGQSIIIASNQEREYTFCDELINIEDFKP